MNSWIYLFVAITSEVIATSALKSSEGFTVLVPSIIVVAGYIAAFYFLSLTLSTIPIGVAYAIWSGVGIAMITLIGWGLFNQKLDLPAIVGILLIVSGVIVMYGLSDSVAH
ncbi:MAG: SMR family transporter [Gammaproteobacteria bacterium]|jgi:small multidrug resistance pump|nr:QacE family quaternary ammonium compound efflux SMR transporter [Gammaproteobacteria bacterium]MCS5579528.1 SMR family transporter [Gammaproteobacteria bacterium]|tara:strand:+ start:547 stop:879 length:333 start_codon:yes stop_codon:yes gene_type:complete